MNKLLFLALLATAVFAITTEDLHEQAQPGHVAPTPQPAHPAQPAHPVQPAHPAQPAHPVQPHPVQQQTKPVLPQNNQQKPVKKVAVRRVSYDSEAGNPFGNEPAVKRTCVKAPCNEPSTGCAAPKKWNTIFYLVPTSSGKKGRFVGYECKWFDKQHIWFSIQPNYQLNQQLIV